MTDPCSTVAFVGPADKAGGWLLGQVMGARVRSLLRNPPPPDREQLLDAHDQPVVILTGGAVEAGPRDAGYTLGAVKSGTWPVGTRFIAMVPHLAAAGPVDLPPLQLGPCPDCASTEVQVLIEACSDPAHGPLQHVHRHCTACDRRWAERS